MMTALVNNIKRLKVFVLESFVVYTFYIVLDIKIKVEVPLR